MQKKTGRAGAGHCLHVYLGDEREKAVMMMMFITRSERKKIKSEFTKK